MAPVVHDSIRLARRSSRLPLAHASRIPIEACRPEQQLIFRSNCSNLLRSLLHLSLPTQPSLLCTGPPCCKRRCSKWGRETCAGAAQADQRMLRSAMLAWWLLDNWSALGWWVLRCRSPATSHSPITTHRAISFSNSHYSSSWSSLELLFALTRPSQLAHRCVQAGTCLQTSRAMSILMLIGSMILLRRAAGLAATAAAAPTTATGRGAASSPQAGQHYV